MLGIRPRTIAGITLLAIAGAASTASAQVFGPQPYGYYAPQPVAMAPGWNPCATTVSTPVYSTAAVDCPCMKTVQAPVYRTVQVPKVVPVEKTVKVAKVITEMQDQEVVTYQTVNEVKTVNVPSYINQTVTECRQVTQNNSYWRTTWQPIPKMSPCLYDGRPGLIGELNRLGYAFRNSITPNAIARREYVPNVVAHQVPVQRTVQIPTTRQVSYTVSRQVPVKTVQKVPVQRTVWVDETVTAYETQMETRTVQVGTETKVVYDSNFNGTATAAEPTPARTAENGNSNQSAAVPKGVLKNNAYETEQKIPLQTPVYRQNGNAPPVSEPQPTPASGPVAEQSVSTPSIVRVAAWSATRRSGTPVQPVQGPELVAQK